MENQDLNAANRFILLTGASSGIGRDMAIQLSAHHRLILNGRDIGRLEETRLSCTNPDSHKVWPYDLSSVGSLGEALSAFLTENALRVSALIHCAGVLKILPLRSIQLQDAKDVFNTNFFSALELTKVLIKKKVNERELKNIVFISSIAAQFGARGFSVYSASKGALDSLMKSLAVELAPDVRVNSVLPGGVRTKMTEAIFEEPTMVAKFQKDYPLGIGEATDITDAVEFLISEKSRWITGQQLVVDGGRTTNITA